MSSKFRPPNASDLIKGVKSFSSLLTLFGYKAKPNVDSILLKLHSSVTSIILVCSLTLLSMNAYFGESIECNSSKSDIPPQQIIRYCWMEGSFSAFHRFDSEKQEGYPGVKPPSEDDKIVYHRYYQWVYFVLIFQSLMFYVPKYIWRRHESSRLVDLIGDLRDNHIASLFAYDKYSLLNDVADCMYTGSTFLSYFILSDLLCFLNLILQMWLTNLFLGGGFLLLGFEWYNYTVSDTRKQTDPLLRIFPRQVKCTFYKYGFSGTQEKIDSLCLLPQNIVNEKIYLFLWAWFMFLLVFTILVLKIRFLYLFPFYRVMTLQANAPCYSKITLRRLCVCVGNWYVLYNIAKNIKPSYFVSLLEELIEEHFDKNGKRKVSTMFRDHLTNRVKCDLKRRAPKSKTSAPKAGWNVDTNNYTNTSNYDNTNNYTNENGANYNYDTNNDYSNQHTSVEYVVNWDDPASPDNTNDNQFDGWKNFENC